MNVSVVVTEGLKRTLTSYTSAVITIEDMLVVLKFETATLLISSENTIPINTAGNDKHAAQLCAIYEI